jgi:ribonucleotide monophosphatase NagD (HAD superfamily)
MIGDNPYVDIKGANDYGFISILVKTGVFSGEENKNHIEHPANYVVDNVGNAVKLIEQLEGI